MKRFPLLAFFLFDRLNERDEGCERVWLRALSTTCLCLGNANKQTNNADAQLEQDSG